MSCVLCLNLNGMVRILEILSIGLEYIVLQHTMEYGAEKRISFLGAIML